MDQRPFQCPEGGVGVRNGKQACGETATKPEIRTTRAGNRLLYQSQEPLFALSPRTSTQSIRAATDPPAEGVAGDGVPSAGCLALHHRHQRFCDLSSFQSVLSGLIKEAGNLREALDIVRELGIVEPLSGDHLPPDSLSIQGTNYRETLESRGCLSRNRAVMVVLEHCYSTLRQLQASDVYLAEAISGFAGRMRQLLPKLTLSEYLQGANQDVLVGQVTDQNLENLTYATASFDVVITNEVFEHVEQLPLALSEIARVLKPGGRLVASCPLAFGQYESIVKARRDPDTGTIDFLSEPDYHGDPVRPEQGAVVFQIPGWDLLDQLKHAGFSDAAFHLVCSWKHGVLGHDIPGVLVLEGLR